MAPLKTLIGNLLLLPMYCYSLPSDTEKPMVINADSLDINQESGIHIYKDNVTIDRGTTHVRGDKLTTYNDQHNKLNKAIIESFTGKPVQYRTLLEEGKPELVATADTIIYLAQRNYVILEGNAKVTQGRDSITGQRLEYDLEKRQLLAPLSKQKGKPSRAQIIIEPDSIASSSTAPSHRGAAL